MAFCDSFGDQLAALFNGVRFSSAFRGWPSDVQDYGKAREWYQKAADLGDEGASSGRDPPSFMSSLGANLFERATIQDRERGRRRLR